MGVLCMLPGLIDLSYWLNLQGFFKLIFCLVDLPIIKSEILLFTITVITITAISVPSIFNLMEATLYRVDCFSLVSFKFLSLTFHKWINNVPLWTYLSWSSLEFPFLSPSPFLPALLIFPLVLQWVVLHEQSLVHHSAFVVFPDIVSMDNIMESSFLLPGYSPHFHWSPSLVRMQRGIQHCVSTSGPDSLRYTFILYPHKNRAKTQSTTRWTTENLHQHIYAFK